MFFLLILANLQSLGSAENVKFSINSEYINYVAEVVDKTFIGGYGPTLRGKELPGSEGTLYKIHQLEMKEIDLGHSAGDIHDGFMLLSLNNASAKIEGLYEAYSFWTTYGNLTLDIAGRLLLNVSVGAGNTLNMTHCTANYSQVDLDLHKSSVNWLAPLLKPTIKTQVKDILCELIDTYFVNGTNKLLDQIPENITGEGGEASLDINEVKISSNSLDVDLKFGISTDIDLVGFEDMKQNLCVQLHEDVIGTTANLFLTPGTLKSEIDIMKLLYGETDGHDDVALHIMNNETLRVGFAKDGQILGQGAVATQLIITPVKGGEEVSLGNIAMGGTLVAGCTYPGQQHIAQYAINRLLPQNKYIELSGFNMNTAQRQMVACTNLKLRDSFIEEIIAMMTS